MNEEFHKLALDAVGGFLGDRDKWSMSACGTHAVHRLERKFCSLVGLPHALAVANATLGLWATLRAANITGGEILTTPYTWGGSVGAILRTGSRPAFADISRDTLVLDPKEVATRITRRTRAILAVDIYGYPSAGEELRRVADRHGLFLIQDCAQSFGSYLGGRHSGFWADAAVFSFGLGKALFAGEGGMIMVRNPELYERLVSATQHPFRQRRDAPHLAPDELALNIRINPFAALVADATFDQALDRVARRRERAVEILGLLYRHRLTRTPCPDPDVAPSFHALTFEPGAHASAIHRFLGKRGEQAMISRPPVRELVYHQPAYRLWAGRQPLRRPNACPVAEVQCRRRIGLSLGQAGLSPSHLGELNPKVRGSY